MTIRAILFLIIASTWLGIHVLALQAELYWFYWWFDLPMHFFGGVVVMLALFVAIDFGATKLRYFTPLKRAVYYVLAVAILWEVYEFGIGMPIESDFWLDTGIDVALGIIGGVVGRQFAFSLDNYT